MKFAKLVIKLGFVVAMLTIGTQMLPQQSIAQDTIKQNELTVKYSQDLDKFLLAVESLHDAGIAFSMDEATPQQLKNLYLKAITSYRRIEFIALHSDGDFVTKHINTPTEKPITPAPVDVDLEGHEGLLVLGELIYNDKPKENMEPILMKTGRLLANTKKFVQTEKDKKISLQTLFEAIKAQMLNYYTLSISGADTSPAETAASRMAEELVSMRDYFLLLQPVHPVQQAIFPKMVEQLDRFALFLKDAKDIESINRMFIAEQFINPVQQDLIILQNTLEE